MFTVYKQEILKHPDPKRRKLAALWRAQGGASSDQGHSYCQPWGLKQGSWGTLTSLLLPLDDLPVTCSHGYTQPETQLQGNWGGAGCRVSLSGWQNRTVTAESETQRRKRITCMLILYVCKSWGIGRVNILECFNFIREFPKNFNFNEIIDSSRDHPQMLKPLNKILIGLPW